MSTTSTSAFPAAEVELVLQTAGRAPSVHNTQPWRWSVRGDVLTLRADRSRQLTHQDPLGRELLLSCGAAAHHAFLAVRSLGRDCCTSWLPDPDDPDVLAELSVLAARPPSQDELRLYRASAARHTDRSAFAAHDVPQHVLDALTSAARTESARLVVLDAPDQVLALDVLATRADDVQRRDAALRAELDGWVRDQPLPDDGVPEDALPDHGTGRGSSLPLRDFAPTEQRLVVTGPPPAEHPLLAVLETDSDEPRDWLLAGAALSRVLLTATAAGLVANPQTQVLEVPGLRARLADELRLAGQPQMVLRLGLPGGTASPRTGRRPVSDVLVEGQP